MKWPEYTWKIVESFNGVGRPGFALAALAIMRLSWICGAGLMLFALRWMGPEAVAALRLVG